MDIVIDIAINLQIYKNRFSKTVSPSLQETLTQAICRTIQKFSSNRDDTVDFLTKQICVSKNKAHSQYLKTFKCQSPSWRGKDELHVKAFSIAKAFIPWQTWSETYLSKLAFSNQALYPWKSLKSYDDGLSREDGYNI